MTSAANYRRSEGIVIETILKEIWDVVVIITRGQNVLFIASVWGIGYAIITKIKKALLKRQALLIKKETQKIDKVQTEKLDEHDKQITTMFTMLDQINLNVIRMQILQGIHQESLSKSELLYFYDKYTKLGGNSFVTEKVNTYLERKDLH